jgi:hypothetical protein
LTSLELADHTGLLLLYAERWSRNPKPAWLPSGRGRDYLELVWSELGKDVAALPQPAADVAGVAATEEE